MTNHLEPRRALMLKAADYLVSLGPAAARALLARTPVHDHLQGRPDLLIRQLRDVAGDPNAFTFAAWKAAQWVMLAKEEGP